MTLKKLQKALFFTKKDEIPNNIYIFLKQVKFSRPKSNKDDTFLNFRLV